LSVVGAGRDAPAAPRLSRAVRTAGSDFLAHSWRLVVPNVVWGIGFLLLLAGVGISWAAWLLAPLLALPTVGIYRVAALIVREEPLSISDGFASWRRYGAQAMVLAVLLLGCVAVFATNLMTGIQNSGVVGWSLATFAGWGLVATAIVACVVWPLLVDPWRESLGLRAVLRLALVLSIAFPFRFGALAIVLGVLVVVSTFAVVVVLTIAIGLAALIASRYVLPAADRFAPPPDRPERLDG
jgi:hypothetical protein